MAVPGKAVSLDTETYRIVPGNAVPDLVLGSAAWLEPGPQLRGILLTKLQTLEMFAAAFDDPEVVVITANGPFDYAVVARAFSRRGIDVFPYLFEFLSGGDPTGRAGRAFDLQFSQTLDAIANGTLGRDPRTGGPLKNPETGKPGSYSLSMCVDLVLGRSDAKVNDEYRLRYGEFDDVPLDDARNQAETGLAQVGVLPKVGEHNWTVIQVDGRNQSVCADCGSTRTASQCLVRRPHMNLHEVAMQTYSAVCLYLGDAHGLRVDQSKVDIIEAYSLRRRRAAIGRFVESGVLREDESENQACLKRLVALAYGATEDCEHCNGTGKIPHPDQPTLRCPDCKGRCQPWKSGGTLKAPTVDNCTRCNNTARVLHHNVKLKGCEVVGANGETEKTCDGTGLLLTPDVPRSESGGVAISRDALTESGDEFLMALGGFKEDAKTLKDYIPYLRTGRVCVHCGQHGTKKYPHAEECPTLAGLVAEQWRDVALTLRSNAILETGRVSYRGYVQLFPRAPGFIDKPTGQYIPSLRECFVARGPSYEVVEVPEDYVLQPGEYVVQEASA
jgi:hypothetical protein